MRAHSALILGLGAALLSLGAGCAPTRVAFRPAKVDPDMMRSYPAAYYPVVIDSKTLGRVKVQTRGAFENDAKQAVVDVQMRLRNDSGAPMTLDIVHSDLELTTRDKATLVVKAPLSSSGETQVAAGAIGRIDLVYALPEGLGVGDVASYELNWSVETSAGPFSESTAFVRQRSSDGIRYVYYPNYGYWGLGWGITSPYYPYFYAPYWSGPYIGDEEPAPDHHRNAAQEQRSGETQERDDRTAPSQPRHPR